jgi:translation initiation factor 2 subunit 2
MEQSEKLKEEKGEFREYNRKLDYLFSNLKKSDSTGERFEIPRCEGRVEGNKTIISNFTQLASILRRQPEHFAKFLMRELAAPGQIENERLTLNRKLNSQRINEKIEQYTKEFVLCSQCGKPDTELIKEKDFLFLKCLACGAKTSVRSKIL